MSVLQYDTLGLKSKPEDFHSPGVYKTLRIHNIENRDGQNNISLKILISLRAKWDFEMRFSFQNLTSEVRKKNLTSNSHFVEVRLEFFQKISLRWSEMRISKKKSHFEKLRWEFLRKISLRFFEMRFFSRILISILKMMTKLTKSDRWIENLGAEITH